MCRIEDTSATARVSTSPRRHSFPRLRGPLKRPAQSRSAALLVSCCLAYSATASAQTDEIEIYDAAIADPGHFELTGHGNYALDGRRQADDPGAVVPNHSLNGALEWAYGATGFLELGLYLPVYTVTNRGNPQFDGFKLRTLWVSPHAQNREFFYGINFEWSYNLHQWEPTRTALEIRPIAGLHEGSWDLIVNPIIDYDFKAVGGAHFAPAERIAHHLSPRWAFAVEHYSDLGPLQELAPVHSQEQTLFAVVDCFISEADSVEFGAGHGFTAASDPFIVKLIVNHDL